jgi:hypothetical protein
MNEASDSAQGDLLQGAIYLPIFGEEIRYFLGPPVDQILLLKHQAARESHSPNIVLISPPCGAPFHFTDS